MQPAGRMVGMETRVRAEVVDCVSTFTPGAQIVRPHTPTFADPFFSQWS